MVRISATALRFPKKITVAAIAVDTNKATRGSWSFPVPKPRNFVATPSYAKACRVRGAAPAASSETSIEGVAEELLSRA